MSLLLLPGYFDPVRAAPAWEAVLQAAAGAGGRAQPGSGVGPVLREEYVALTARLRSAGIRCVGYVDTDYGRRGVDDVRGEVAAWRDRYDVDGVFFEQARADVAGLDAYERHVGEARSLGCRTVVLNPGCYPLEAYAHLANLVVVFEGDAQQHRSVRVPPWARRLPANRFGHLVYGVEPVVPRARPVRRRATSSHGRCPLRDRRPAARSLGADWRPTGPSSRRACEESRPTGGRGRAGPAAGPAPGLRPGRCRRRSGCEPCAHRPGRRASRSDRDQRTRPVAAAPGRQLAVAAQRPPGHHGARRGVRRRPLRHQPRPGRRAQARRADTSSATSAPGAGSRADPTAGAFPARC